MSARQPPRPPLRTRIVPGVLRRLKRLGIRVEPFLVVREGEGQPDPEPSQADLRFAFLTEADIDELLRLEKQPPRETLQEWFRLGRLCFGVKDGDRLIAKMWCDIDTFNFPPNFRRLAADEVYLFAAYADPEYRGQNLAPAMRMACYTALREMGRTRFWSYTDYYNFPARRFKKKLGARDETLRCHVDLFGWWSRTFSLKRY